MRWDWESKLFYPIKEIEELSKLLTMKNVQSYRKNFDLIGGTEI